MGSIATPLPLAVPSANRVEPGSFPLRTAAYPTSSTTKALDADSIASQWIESFNKAIPNPSLTSLAGLFLPESYWRDQLCLTWDFHTLQGPKKTFELLQQSKSESRLRVLSLDKSSTLRSPTSSVLGDDGQVNAIQAFLTVDTDVGRGAGVVRLVQENGTWKVFTLYTFLKDLNGHEEVIGKKRPNGVQHGEHISRENWLDRRKAEQSFDNGQEPTVLILGAGQAGLTIAARLKMLNIKSLIVDREERIGDNWRGRYHQLVLHDAVWFDHLPYMPFPESWPVFTPKDKLGDWFESYVSLLELNAWTRSTITSSSWDEASGKWTVTVERKLGDKTNTRVLHPKHLIQATGHSGLPNFPSHISGLSTFTGKTFHSSTFPGATPSKGQNKRAIVVGSCNSGHDIAQDLYENGYAVTMIQRSSTFVVTAETNFYDMSALYGEDGPPTEDADMLFHSFPNPVVKRMNIAMTKHQNESDKVLLAGLTKAGFTLDKGPDESGLWIKYLQRGGGYYLDVGCSSLIAAGKIAVKSGVSINSVLPTGIQLSSGEILDADEIVFATGYLNMRSQCEQIFGKEVSEKVADVWGFDEEGELRTMWRRSGKKGFWFMGGNLALCRWFSKMLALQIKGLEEGIYQYEDL